MEVLRALNNKATPNTKGRLTHPQGKLMLTMSANDAVKKKLLFYLDPLKKAA